MAVLQFLIFVTVLLVSYTSAGYVYSNIPVNWLTAKSSCENIGGSLLGQTPILEDYVDKLPVWINGMVAWSPWIAYAGCYRYVEQLIEIRSFYTLKENNALSCLQKCKDQLPVGLLNLTCYCLTTFPDIKKVSGSYCQTPCPGNTNELCGGSGRLRFHEYITIYGSISETRTRDVGLNPCLTVELSGKLYKYKDRRCTVMFPVLCQDSKRYLIERMERKQWQDAVNECKTFNLELADFQTIEKNKFMENKEFWSGYYRKSYAVWQTDGDVKNKAGCYLLEKTGYKIENCNKTNYYICLKDGTTSSISKTRSFVAITLPTVHKENQETVDCAVLVGISVACVVVFTMVVAAIAIIIYRKKRLKKKRGIQERTNSPQFLEITNTVEENKDLLCTDMDFSQTEQLSDDNISENTNIVQPSERTENEAYNHLQLNGQRVSFNVDSANNLHGSYSNKNSNLNGSNNEHSTN